MVDFIGIERVQELVSRRGAARFIEELSLEIESDFLRWSEFEKSPRLASHSRVGGIELMPASDGRLYAFKYVNGHPKNTAVGLLTVTAFGVLADVATGYPLLLSELTLTTALRTAATSALAARRMARPGLRPPQWCDVKDQIRKLWSAEWGPTVIFLSSNSEGCMSHMGQERT